MVWLFFVGLSLLLGCTSFSCEEKGGVMESILQRVDAFAEEERYAPRRVTFVASSGLGDQVSGFLAAVAFAMVTGRRLEVASTGFFGLGFEPRFPADATVAVSRLPNPGRHSEWSIEEWHGRVREEKSEKVATSNLFFGAPHLLRLAKRRPAKELASSLDDLFDKDHEIIDFGNTGYYVLSLWLETFLSKKTAARHHARAMACVLRRTLKFSPEVEAYAKGLLSKADQKNDVSSWSSAESNHQILGLHLRAERYMRGGIYGDDIKDDTVFGCAPPNFQVANFTDLWDAARHLEGELAGKWRWLLVTDSASLKKNALDTFGPDKIIVTDVVPTHNEPERRKGDCHHRRRLQNAEVAALAELWLLAHSNAIIHGDSKYSTTAVFFCDTCRRVVYLASCKERSPPVRRLCGDDERRIQKATGAHVRLDQVGGDVDVFTNLHSF